MSIYEPGMDRGTDAQIELVVFHRRHHHHQEEEEEEEGEGEGGGGGGTM
jgi:hypothetical protein